MRLKRLNPPLRSRLMDSRTHATPDHGFTLIELVVAAAVLAIVMAIGFRSYASFLQERRLRQSAIELVSYLQAARVRATKQSENFPSIGGRYCSLVFQSTNDGWTLATSPFGLEDPNNICKDTPPLQPLNIAATSGVQGLDLSTNSNVITFTNKGFLSSTNPQGVTIAVPAVIYLFASQTVSQYCIYLNLVSIRLGYRNSDRDSCTYNRG